jgi:NADPH-dependent 2,4-dienoyl-CoA reductase/sulfur reductase-like enzyme
MSAEHADVAVVGAGPAGLAAATELRRLGVRSVLVLEREHTAGGVPRHCGHQGFGLRDVHRVMPGPSYAARWVRSAERAGAELRVGTQVTGWSANGGLELTGPGGRTELSAGAVLLATGCRERPRSARLIAGSRPQGVMNTGTLQQLVRIGHERVGSRAVVVGAEHVSFSAVETLREAGARTVAMTTELPRHQSFAAFHLGARVRHGTRLLTLTAVKRIIGEGRLRAVDLESLHTGEVTRVECDLLILTADWIPDHELAVLAGADLDPGTRGPAVDAAFHTSRPGLFASGNLLHGAEPADIAALSGRRAAAAVLAHLSGEPWPAAGVAVRCEDPLRWIAPNIAGAPASGRHLLRSSRDLVDVRVRARQDGRVLATSRLARVSPGRSASLGCAWADLVDPLGGPVILSVLSARPRR